MINQLNIPVFTAMDYLNYLNTHGLVPAIAAPKILILCFQNELLKYVTRNYRIHKNKIFGSDLYLLKKYHSEIGVFGGFGSGAPATASVVDLFSAFGVEQFAIIGLAGGLQPELQTGSIVLSTGAIRGEGVSSHYLPLEEIVNSSPQLLNSVSSVLDIHHIQHHKGITWTTDAPFRELRADVLEYQRRGILAVDMESAGMFSVAKANNRLAFSAFSITDMLIDGIWSMPPDLKLAKSNLGVIFDSVCEALSGI